jgi:hypothetical protein
MTRLFISNIYFMSILPIAKHLSLGVGTVRADQETAKAIEVGRT